MMGGILVGAPTLRVHPMEPTRRHLHIYTLTCATLTWSICRSRKKPTSNVKVGLRVGFFVFITTEHSFFMPCVS